MIVLRPNTIIGTTSLGKSNGLLDLLSENLLVVSNSLLHHGLYGILQARTLEWVEELDLLKTNS